MFDPTSRSNQRVYPAFVGSEAVRGLAGLPGQLAETALLATWRRYNYWG